jgi:hypothetical protein
MHCDEIRQTGMERVDKATSTNLDLSTNLYLLIKELTFPWFGPSLYAFVRRCLRFVCRARVRVGFLCGLESEQS